MKRFEEKRIIVTGGTRGIGRAITLAFAAEGAHVFAAYLSNEAAAEETAAEAATLSGTVTPVRADVATSEGAQAVIAAATAEGRRLDVLVNNAGIIRDCFLPMMSENDWESVLRTNLDPLFHCCKWGVRKMMAARTGAIVNISSISGITGTAGQTNYSASKGAIISFTKSLAREVGAMGIRVNAVVPGLIETEMIGGMKKDIVDKVVGASALGRIGRADEVAAAVLFLASQDASYITGQNLVVDGGTI